MSRSLNRSSCREFEARKFMTRTASVMARHLTCWLLELYRSKSLDTRVSRVQRVCSDRPRSKTFSHNTSNPFISPYAFLKLIRVVSNTQWSVCEMIVPPIMSFSEFGD
eukprot:g4817.t1